MVRRMRASASRDADATAVVFKNVAAVMPDDTAANPLVGSEAGTPSTKFAAENGVSCPTRISPALRMRATSSSVRGVATASCRCSGANASTTSQACASEATSTAPPLVPSAARAALARTSGRSRNAVASSASIASTMLRSVATSTTVESSPCSASINKSSAARRGSVESSATIMLSVGPSTIIVVAPCRCISTCAAVTAGLPGPTIFRTAAMVCVPKPSAAMAAGPFARYTSSIPSIRHTTKTAGSTRPEPSGIGGTTSAMRGTPATTAGTPSWYATDG